MPFLTKLQAEEVEDPCDCWRLITPLIYIGRDKLFSVPTGFITDLGSVPWIFQWLVPAGKRGRKAFVLHDYLYKYGLVSRADADGILRRVMKEIDCWKIRYWSAWIGVRLGGWFPWRNYRKEEAKECS